MSPRRRRRRPVLVAVIAVVLVLLLLETALVIGVFASPRTADRLKEVAASIDRTWNGTEGEPGLRTRAAETVSNGYHDWVQPLFGASSTSKGDDEFSECVDCHKDYATKRKYSSVYMDHPLHAQIGVACETCHTQNAHPNPARPEEKTCATCHAEVSEQNKCGTCHPPGSLPHFYLLGVPRQAQVECDTCHPQSSFGEHATVPKVGGTFTGQDPTQCLKCHNPSNTDAPLCLQCHQDPTHPANWLQTHGPEAGQSGLNDCYTCHTGTWCGTRCHSVTSVNPFTKQPLPVVGARP